MKVLHYQLSLAPASVMLFFCCSLLPDWMQIDNVGLKWAGVQQYILQQPLCLPEKQYYSGVRAVTITCSFTIIDKLQWSWVFGNWFSCSKVKLRYSTDQLWQKCQGLGLLRFKCLLNWNMRHCWQGLLLGEAVTSSWLEHHLPLVISIATWYFIKLANFKGVVCSCQLLWW